MPDDIAFSTRFLTRCKSKLFRHMIFIRLKEAARLSYAALESRLSLLDWHLTHPAYREFVHLFFGYYEPLGEKLMNDVDFCCAQHANAHHAKPVSDTAPLKILQDISSYWLACTLPPN